MQEFTENHKQTFGEEFNWKKIIKKCDTDQDGKISYEEFFTAASDRTKVLNKKYLKQAFRIMDINDDGKIEAHEVQACFAKGKMGDFKEKGVEIEEGYF